MVTPPVSLVSWGSMEIDGGGPWRSIEIIHRDPPVETPWVSIGLHGTSTGLSPSISTDIHGDSMEIDRGDSRSLHGPPWIPTSWRKHNNVQPPDPGYPSIPRPHVKPWMMGHHQECLARSHPESRAMMRIVTTAACHFVHSGIRSCSGAVQQGRFHPKRNDVLKKKEGGGRRKDGDALECVRRA